MSSYILRSCLGLILIMMFRFCDGAVCLCVVANEFICIRLERKGKNLDVYFAG